MELNAKVAPSLLAALHQGARLRAVQIQPQQHAAAERDEDRFRRVIPEAIGGRLDRSLVLNGFPRINESVFGICRGTQGFTSKLGALFCDLCS